MWRVRFDTTPFERAIRQYEHRDIPIALVRTLNDIAFDTRQAWKDAMPQIFDRPVALTLNAVLYKKASVKEPVAEVFIRDKASGGTPPAQYLLAQVVGGSRSGKRSENLLRRAGILGPGEFWVPGQSAPLDASGNMPRGVVTTILSDVQASFDSQSFSTAESRRRRTKRNARKGKRGGVYFLSRGKGTQIGPRRTQNLPRGIYERLTTGFGSGVRMVMAFVSKVSYRKRFDPLAITRGVFDRRFEARFNVWVERLRIR